MKKIICLMLSLIMFISFVSCKEEQKPLSRAESDAMNGILNGVKYALGTDIDTIKDYYEQEIEQNGEESDYNSVNKYDDYTCISTLSDIYYYKNDKVDEGVAFLASFAKVWEYEIGITMKEDIIEDLAGTYSEYVATEEQMFFFPSFEENCDVLSVEVGQNKILSFYFVNGFLAASSLEDTEIWN